MPSLPVLSSEPRLVLDRDGIRVGKLASPDDAGTDPRSIEVELADDVRTDLALDEATVRLPARLVRSVRRDEIRLRASVDTLQGSVLRMP